MKLITHPASSAQVKNTWSQNSTHPYALMGYTGDDVTYAFN